MYGREGEREKKREKRRERAKKNMFMACSWHLHSHRKRKQLSSKVYDIVDSNKSWEENKNIINAKERDFNEMIVKESLRRQY